MLPKGATIFYVRATRYGSRPEAIIYFRKIMPVYFRTPSRKRLHKMNRRQHKKLHLGEFQTLIFGVQGSLHQAADDAEAFGRFMDELIAYLVVNGLEMAGGGDCGDFSCLFQKSGA